MTAQMSTGVRFRLPSTRNVALYGLARGLLSKGLEAQHKEWTP